MKIETVYLDPSRMQNSPVCIECGANRGRFAAAFIKKFGGIVEAYEPGRIADEIPDLPGIKVHRDAIWTKCGPLRFCECQQQPQTSSVYDRKPRRGVAETIDVHATSLKIALRGFDWVDMLNMDIEGAEWPILDSSAVRYLRRVDQICIEFHMEFAGPHLLESVLKRLSDDAWFDMRLAEESSKRPIYYGCKRKMSPRKSCNKWMREILSKKKYDKVLNLGCGTDDDKENGIYSKYINATKIIKTDIENLPGVDCVASAENLPFDDDSFDLIFANWVIYKTDLPKSLAEINRVLRPDGDILVTYGLPDPNFITAITSTLRSMFTITDYFSYEYAAKRKLRRAEGVFGSLRPDIDRCFNIKFTPPVLVIVAHWDDEVLSFGGTLGQIGKGWDVVCATHRDQQPTYQKIFDGIGNDLGFNAFTLDVRQRERAIKNNEDRHDYTRTVSRIPLDVATVEPELRKALGDLTRYKTVITHSDNGDYGSHPQHIELADTITQIFGNNADVWSFNAKAGTVCRELNPVEVDNKLELIRRYKPSHKRVDVFNREYFIRLNRIK